MNRRDGIGAVLVAAAVGLGLTACSGHSTPGNLDLSSARTLSCPTAIPAAKRHPQPVLTRVFAVHGPERANYTLGWQLVPFRGPGRTYQLGQDGNLLALQPAGGGKPLGYGTGDVAVSGDPQTGTIDAVVHLASGRRITVHGTWRCG
jgi:hypothetical protein